MRIYSIFRSIDGEINLFHQGIFSTFIRCAGCNLSCPYCDTLYALSPTAGRRMSVKSVVSQVKDLGCPKVTITGGEPLLQPDFFALTKELKKEGFFISVETNGSRPMLGFDVDSWVVDYKLTNSGMRSRMDEGAFSHLRSSDFVKFVVGSLVDCIEAKEVRKELENIGCGAKFAFSPLHGELDPKDLIRYLEELGQLDVIVNLQLHKYIGLVEDSGNDE